MMVENKQKAFVISIIVGFASFVVYSLFYEFYTTAERCLNIGFCAVVIVLLVIKFFKIK